MLIVEHMFRSYRLGRLFGFPIEVNLSFLLMLAAVLLFMGGLAGVAVILLAFTSVLAHEFGHALVARHLGVGVSGIELHFFGGVAKLMGQARTARHEVAIAAAGPAVSFVLGGVGLALHGLTGLGLFSLLGWINLVIGTFNLIPAFPMDGGRIFRALLTTRLGFQRATKVAVTVSRAVSIVFAIVGLATGSFQLMLLAGVLWYLSASELRTARFGGYRDAPSSGFAPVDAAPSGVFRRHRQAWPMGQARPRVGYSVRQIGDRIVVVREQ